MHNCPKHEIQRNRSAMSCSLFPWTFTCFQLKSPLVFIMIWFKRSTIHHTHRSSRRDIITLQPILKSITNVPTFPQHAPRQLLSIGIRVVLNNMSLMQSQFNILFMVYGPRRADWSDWPETGRSPAAGGPWSGGAPCAGSSPAGRPSCCGFAWRRAVDCWRLTGCCCCSAVLSVGFATTRHSALRSATGLGVLWPPGRARAWPADAQCGGETFGGEGRAR